MKWVLLTGGVLVAFVALVAVVGWFLPKGHVASRTVRFRAAPDVVWGVLTDHASQPSWRTELRAVERLSDQNGHPVWREVDKRGDKLTLETIESVPPHRLVRRIADPSLPFGGTWTYELATAQGGTALTITENGEVYNPIFRFVSRFFLGHTTTIENFLRALGAKLGEEVRFD